MVTISDVAKEAGVSVSTASRALNNSFMVSQEKKDRVLEAVKKLDYRPIRISAARRAQQNKIIVVVPVMMHGNMLDSIRRTAEELGYQTAIALVGENRCEGYRNALEFVKMLPSHLLCGLVFIHNECRDQELWAEFCNYPLVQIGVHQNTSPRFCVMIDDHEAAYDMTTYLIQQGYKKIAYVRTLNELEYSYNEQRLSGYRQALADAGLPFEEAFLYTADYFQEGGIDVARELLKKKEKPDAVFCGSDYIAFGCISELQRHGLRVPDDIAVCGFDNMDFCEYTYPSLTTVNQPFDEMGAEAVRLLNTLVTGTLTSGRKVIASHTVLGRDSA